MVSVVATDKDIGDIRNPLDIERLNTFLSGPKPIKLHIGPGILWPIIEAPVTVSQFKYGQSNPTYLLTGSCGKRLILRRKPSRNSELLSKKAHNIEREFWINYDIEYLNRTRGFKVPVAKPQILCEDESVIGVVFYISEFVDGSIFHDPSMPTLSNEQRIRCWQSAIRAGIEIHQLPVEKLGHSFPQPKVTKPKSKLTYFQRQVKALEAIEKAQSSQPKTPRIYGFDKISEYLAANSPEDPAKPLLVHGDFKIDNFIFNLNTFEVIAVLDWELCTLGSPSFDLANLLQNYYFPEQMNKVFLDVSLAADPHHVHTVLKYYTQTVREKADKDNNNLRDWLFYSGSDFVEDSPSSCTVFKYWTYSKVFACYRLSVIMQGIHARVVTGTSSSGFAEKYLNSYHKYTKLAEAMISAEPKLQAKL